MTDSPRSGSDRLSKRLRISFGAVLVITAALGISSFFASVRLTELSQTTFREDILGLSTLSRTVTSMKHMRLLQYRHMLTSDPTEQQRTAKKILESEHHADQLLTRYEQTVPPTDTVERPSALRLREVWDEYKNVSEQFIVESTAHRREQSEKLLSITGLRAATEINELTDHICDINEAEAYKHVMSTVHIAQWERRVAGLAVVIASLIYGLLWRGVSRRVVKPAHQIKQALNDLASNRLATVETAMRALSKGDFTKEISGSSSALSIESNDEFGETAQAVNLVSARVDAIATSYLQAKTELDALISALIFAAHPGAKAEAPRYDHDAIGADTMESQFEYASDAIDSVIALQTDLRSIAVESKRVADEAKDLSQTKSEFLATVGRELQPAMNGVLVAADLLATMDSTQERAEVIDIIRSSGALLLNIVRDILDFSKLETSILALDSAPFNPISVIEESLRMFEFQTRQKGIQLNSILENEGILVNGDSIRFGQLAINLLGNAIKFTEQGSVTVRCAVQPVDDERAFIELTVSDTGIGISSEFVDKIFAHFTQVDGGTTRNYGGIGLGLSISKGIVTAMDGTIAVSSKPDEGSTFVVTAQLPISKEYGRKYLEHPQVPLIQGESNACRILLGAGDELNRVLASKMLVQAGYNVVSVDSGIAALEAVCDKRFQLLLLSWHMPEMDGLEITRMIRTSSQPWSDIPIIALRANPKAGDHVACLEAGMDDYISMPFSRDEFLATVAKWAEVSKAA